MAELKSRPARQSRVIYAKRDVTVVRPPQRKSALFMSTESGLETTPQEALEVIRSTLRLTYRISITDGRIFLGTFASLDKAKNIVLLNAEEYRPENIDKTRYVGLIMIPWRWIVKAEVEDVS